MLHFLSIRNLALMDAVALDLPSGFVAVTGETGAGKSVLLGALSLLAGNRADKSIIRDGADHCAVEAAFLFANPAPINNALLKLDLPPCEDGQLILRRTITRSKPSRVHINGTLSTLANLQALGALWIDFHGPGEPQKLFDEAFQLTILDRFADHPDALQTYADAFTQLRSARRERAELAQAHALSPDEQAFLKSRIEAIDQLNLSDDRVAALESAANRLAHAREMSELSSALANALADDDGIAHALANAVQLARRLQAIDPDAAALASRVESLAIEADDLAADCNALCDDLDLDPAAARQIEADMDAWLDLKRKFGPSVDAVLAQRNAMAQRLHRQSDLKGAIADADQRIKAAESTARALAADLRSARLRAAASLTRQCLQRLKSLGFKHPQFRIDCSPQPNLDAVGDCAVSFQFSPNPGQPLMPLNKIASSGELARVMLALKSVLAAVDETPVLVFDEVDANIGGEIAATVAQQLADLGAQHQVFCITHLPQVAARAHAHFQVSKSQSAQITSVAITQLPAVGPERVKEIARMLGDRNSASARSHASSLLALP